MSFRVTVRINTSFTTAASCNRVFDLLSDVPRSGSFFPKVRQLAALGNNAWRWEMAPIGIGDYTLQQTVYACGYLADKEQKTVTWKPIEEIGNAVIEGQWAIQTTAQGSQATLFTQGTLTIDMPGFLEILLSPLIKLEFEGLIEEYIGNLKKEFEKPENN